MDDRELQKLRAILVERLIGGEDPDALEAQLGVRLAPAEANALLAEARDLVEAQRGAPGFERIAEEIRERRRGSFWRGPILSREHGERVAKIAAGWFGGIGVVVLLLLAANGRRDLSMLILALLFVLPAVALWTRRSSVAAGVLVGLTAFACISSLFLIVGVLMSGGVLGGTVFAAAAAIAPWVILLLLALRAFSATRYLKRQVAIAPDPAVFE